MAQQELCFIAFPIVILTESFNNGQKLLGETHLFARGALSALERREVRYPIGPLDFLERGDLSTVSSSPPSPLPTSASSAMSTDADKFLADLVVELVPLPTSASSALSIDDGEFLADWVGVVLSIKVSGPANLFKP